MSDKLPHLETGFVITQSVIDGVQEGEIIELDGFYFIIHKCGYSSIVDQITNFESLFEIFNSERIPRYFHIFNPPENLIPFVKQQSEKYNIVERFRLRFVYDLNSIIPFESANEINNIDINNIDSLEEFDLSLGQKYWKDKTDFIENSFGCFVSDLNHKPMAICYAAAVSRKMAEIDIKTLPSFQGKGLGKLIAAKFIEQCLNRSITPYWDCFSDNTGSYKIARELGFRQLMHYKLVSIYKK